MPLVNLALWLGYEGSVGAVFVVLGASVLIVAMPQSNTTEDPSKACDAAQNQGHP